ncbi:lipopolysaccharide assembly protein LapB [Sporosarcina sp. Te-1]|uniref:tetratricopeptide repeat protein n=1 Tax=Sporosarcina sp. Te-1 TaxID=2818390 RepID=UPI001A9DFE84|nr:tetratricopeptide repeat protein [Sporosarcina sp. Te-1]QTD40862.1 tetratricopeptide repeat protein [Sporosarcina sp. Te-1]
MENGRVAQLQRIVHLIEWQRYKEAIRETESYLRDYPEDADGYGLLGKIYYLSDEYEKAMHWSTEALKADPKNALGWEVRAETFYTQEKWKEAMATIEGAMAIFPEDGFYYLLAGNIYNQRKKYAKAKDMFQTSLKLRPQDAMSLASYSYTESLLGNREASKEAEQQALQNNPNDAEVFMYCGWAAEQRGEYDAALRYMENAVRLVPKHPQYRTEYLEILQKQFKMYRFFLPPAKYLSSIKPVYALLLWLIVWFIFKPLVLIFLFLYVAAHWITKMIVNLRVFGKIFIKA